MFVNKAQKFFIYSGYYTCEPLREAIRTFDRFGMRIKPLESNYRSDEVQKRILSAVKNILATGILIKATGSLFGTSLLVTSLYAPVCVPGFFYVIASLIGRGRFELIEPNSPVPSLKDKSIKVLGWNTCFQDPWCTFTGGVVPPFEYIDHGVDRLTAAANAVQKENPTVFLGQEFDNIGAQDKFIRLMQKRGYHYFLRDLGDNPITNHSGLFVASKVPIKDIAFVPYPWKDRAGLAKVSGQGALAITVSVNGKDLRLVNVHLNYPGGEENKAAGMRQLKKHVVPLLQKGPSVLFGDLNMNTLKINHTAAGLINLTNALEGKVTCSDQGKHTLLGKAKTCEDCEESIDGIIYDQTKIKLENPKATPLEQGTHLLSDHYATTATISLK